MLSVPVCWSRLRLEMEPDVDPLWDVMEAGMTARDCKDPVWVEVDVGVPADCGVEVFVAVGATVDVNVAVGGTGVFDGVRVMVGGMAVLVNV